MNSNKPRNVPPACKDEGGGSVTSIKAATSRASTSLGSSSSYPATASLADVEVGGTYGVVAPYFNPDAGANPLFHNWSHVYVKYCTATSTCVLAPLRLSQR